MSFFVWLEAESNRHIRRAFISRVALPLSYRAAVMYFTVLHSLLLSFFNCYRPTCASQRPCCRPTLSLRFVNNYDGIVL